MVKFDYSKLPTADTVAAKNIYVVSKLRTGTSNFNVVALNYDEAKTYARSLELIENNLDVTTASFAVNKYDSYEALKAYYATEEGKEALAMFDTAYWGVTTKGFPILGYNALDWVENLGTGMFSGWLDDAAGYDVDTDGDNQVLPFNIDGTVTGVYLKENISSEVDLTAENNLYANGKVNITNTSTRAIEYKTILIQTAEGNFYEAQLEVYTRIINSKEDLRMFDLDSATTTRTFTGYYALGNDIVDTEATYNSNYKSGCYFQGILDGKGHSLTFTTTVGLFGYQFRGASTNSSTVKNINFKDCTITANTGTYQSSLLGCTYNAAPLYLQNLSVSLSDATYNNLIEKNKDSHILMYDAVTSGNPIVCQNVIVEFDYSKLPTAEETSTYVINVVSKLRKNTSNFYVVALNYDATKTYSRTLNLIGNESSNAGTVTKYGSYGDFKTYFESTEGQTALATFTTYWDVTAGYPVWKKQN